MSEEEAGGLEQAVSEGQSGQSEGSDGEGSLDSDVGYSADSDSYCRAEDAADSGYDSAECRYEDEGSKAEDSYDKKDHKEDKPGQESSERKDDSVQSEMARGNYSIPEIPEKDAATKAWIDRLVDEHRAWLAKKQGPGYPDWICKPDCDSSPYQDLLDARMKGKVSDPKVPVQETPVDGMSNGVAYVARWYN